MGPSNLHNGPRLFCGGLVIIWAHALVAADLDVDAEVPAAEAVQAGSGEQVKGALSDELALGQRRLFFQPGERRQFDAGAPPDTGPEVPEVNAGDRDHALPVRADTTVKSVPRQRVVLNGVVGRHHGPVTTWLNNRRQRAVSFDVARRDVLLQIEGRRYRLRVGQSLQLPAAAPTGLVTR